MSSIIKDIVTFSMFAGLLIFNHWFLGGSAVVDVMFIILTLGFLASKHSKTRFEGTKKEVIKFLTKEK